MAKVYLAGPGVFRPDAHAWGQRLQGACAAHGLHGLYPLDGALPAQLTQPAEQRFWIYANNCALIRQADAVFADLRAFRSASEPDSGTAFEVGFAQALGKPVWLWLPDCTPGTVLHQREPGTLTAQGWVDARGQLIEDFAAPLNLMLWEAAAGVSHDAAPEAALAALAAYLAADASADAVPT